VNRGPFRRFFSLLQEHGNVAEREMFTTFNMGIGMVLVLDPQHEVGRLAKRFPSTR
jgi:phosphoribosylformylglycinamidine cyclo-ligase